MQRQFLTFCNRCGKQILMTQCQSTGRWVPCNPLIDRYIPDEGNEVYIDQAGCSCRGRRDRRGQDWGYTHHGRECAGWQGS